MNQDVQTWLDQFDHEKEVDPITLFVDSSNNGKIGIWR